MRGLYAIVDVGTLDAAGIAVLPVVDALLRAAPPMLQLRAKNISAERTHDMAFEIAARCAGTSTAFVVNDDPNLAARVGAQYVHLGQGDASPREVLLSHPEQKIGLSTHTELELVASLAMPLSYVALGPVYGTQTKADAAPVVPWELVQRARALCMGRPLVVIGGIDEERARALVPHVDMVAVIGALVDADMAEVAARARRLQALFASC